MSDRGKFLVLGASGLVGRHVSALLGRERVVATYRSHPIDGAVFFDASSMRLHDTLLRGNHDFAAALVLYGITKLDDCARDPAGTALVNVASVKKVIDDLIDARVKPIFASSDAVFDGSVGMKDESAPTQPTLTYGKQKLEVEHHLQASKGPWAIARLSKLVSSAPESRNLLNEWADGLDGNVAIRCASDLIFSPADVNDAAQVLIQMAEDSFSGVFHVCGPQAMRRLDLLNLLIRKIKERKDIRPYVSICSMRDLDFYEPRPLDVSMQPRKLYSALGKPFRSMDAVCAELVANRYGIVAGSSLNAR